MNSFYLHNKEELEFEATSRDEMAGFLSALIESGFDISDMNIESAGHLTPDSYVPAKLFLDNYNFVHFPQNCLSTYFG